MKNNFFNYHLKRFRHNILSLLLQTAACIKAEKYPLNMQNIFAFDKLGCLKITLLTDREYYNTYWSVHRVKTDILCRR